MKSILFLALNFFLILTPTNPKTSSIKGNLCYPSESIPELKVYLKNTENGKTITLLTKLNQKKFEFTNVPDGSYIAYAYPVAKGSEELKGGYTKAVPCGLSVDCKDHTLLPFTVKAGEKLTPISICDFYGAIVPAAE